MNKTTEKQGNRTAFIRQSARVLLVDYSTPFDADTCEYLQETLVNFFSLVTHLSGPCRTPFFGLIALTSPPENLFYLQHVRGNFPKLYTAFKELNNIAKDVSPRVSSSDVIVQGLKEAIAQFKRQSQSLRQMSTSNCQLEITLFTCRAATSVVRHIEAFLKDIELESIKKIQVVTVQSSEELNKKEGTPSESGSSPSGDTSELLDGSLVDVVSLGKDVLSFENFFKIWLLDRSTDQEHLRIILPGAFTQDSEGDQSQDNVTETSLSLKCDLHECLLDPFHLPYQSHLWFPELNRQTVCAESANINSKGVAITKPHVLNYPVYNLTAMKLVKTEAVCESVLFGMPYIVRPTLCWKLDWEDLESNQQHFYALCSVLKERGLSLLAKTNGPRVALRGYPQQAVTSSPHGHFIFLPSDNSLLLKSIAIKELMLPSVVQSSTEGPSDDALSVVASCLDQIDVCDSYNPLLVQSNLYKCLIAQSIKSNPASKSVKRRVQAPQASKQEGRGIQLITNQQPKRTTSRAQMQQVVFTPPRETLSNTAQNEFRSAAAVFSASKRFRSNSAANLYNSKPPVFPDNL
ncbi:meiosis 1 arrest protein-like [Stylophora pistillata]|uniref:meiosis 1 arrest protein-like n=1 Tax=Stylophora pistillata TaxID=50429 RepID=UPI000C04A473|nr:meiosis 1 arrest protein-like [Stylophora pistillata]